jgi:hypothetical protein
MWDTKFGARMPSPSKMRLAHIPSPPPPLPLMFLPQQVPFCDFPFLYFFEKRTSERSFWGCTRRQVGMCVFVSVVSVCVCVCVCVWVQVIAE